MDLGIPMTQEEEISMDSLLDLYQDLPYKPPAFKTNFISLSSLKTEKETIPMMNKFSIIKDVPFTLQTQAVE